MNVKLYPLEDHQAKMTRAFCNQGEIIRAIYTGACRPPRKGEWYISGGGAWQSRRNYPPSMSFNIAQLVTYNVMTEKITPVFSNIAAK